MKQDIDYTFSFDAGHVCTQADGPCNFPHGHSYVLIVRCRGGHMQAECQNGHIQKIVQAMLDEFFIHKWLNESLRMELPTLENIAEWIFHYLDSKCQVLQAVVLYDGPSHQAIYKK